MEQRNDDSPFCHSTHTHTCTHTIAHKRQVEKGGARARASAKGFVLFIFAQRHDHFGTVCFGAEQIVFGSDFFGPAAAAQASQMAITRSRRVGIGTRARTRTHTHAGTPGRASAERDSLLRMCCVRSVDVMPAADYIPCALGHLF